MHTESREVLISKIFDQAPNQLPPVLYINGTYQLDISYQGHTLHKLADTLEACLQAYYDLVNMVNYQHRIHKKELDGSLPVPLGASIPHTIL